MEVAAIKPAEVSDNDGCVRAVRDRVIDGLNDMTRESVGLIDGVNG